MARDATVAQEILNTMRVRAFARRTCPVRETYVRDPDGVVLRLKPRPHHTFLQHLAISVALDSLQPVAVRRRWRTHARFSAAVARATIALDAVPPAELVAHIVGHLMQPTRRKAAKNALSHSRRSR